MGFTSLNHHLDLPWLYEAYRRTRKDGAVGVDGQTAEAYAENLEKNLQDLLNRAKSGRYYATPVRRVHIPKGKGNETRPLGIPTFEDKVLQRAAVMALEPLYEEDFHEGSYGFRPFRSAHQALQALWDQTMKIKGGWILDVDIRKFFDTLDHAHLRSLVQHRVRDGVLQRLIGKWLNAGVMEDGALTYPEGGTPQGGVISPLLANIYLHYVLDEWFEKMVKPCMAGPCFLIRYADDFVMGFAFKEDAQRTLNVLPKRFGKFGLALHPDKTRMVAFGRPPRRGPSRKRGGPGGRGPGSFRFLGFTHYWGRSRKGNWVVQRKTASSRLSRAIATVAQWCRRHRHLPIAEQQCHLSHKLRGHYAYYGITGNARSLARFHLAVTRRWRKWLGRRRRNGAIPWAIFNRLLEHYPLPPPVVVHSVYRSR
jgi:group II intron reverse transcriptase/maturase